MKTMFMSRTVFYIKLVHSVLFFLIGICTIYLLYAAALDRVTTLTWVAFGVVVLELTILVFNDWRCPLTVFAETKGAESGSVADLFLPAWLSEQLFRIFGILFAISCVLLLWRTVTMG